jgi:hypothetical protein
MGQGMQALGTAPAVACSRLWTGALLLRAWAVAYDWCSGRKLSTETMILLSVKHGESTLRSE